MEDRIKKVFSVLKTDPNFKDDYKDVTIDQFKSVISSDKEARAAIHQDLVEFGLVSTSDADEYWSKVGIVSSKPTTQPANPLETSRQLAKSPVGVLAPAQQPSIDEVTTRQIVGNKPVGVLAPKGQPQPIEIQAATQAVTPVTNPESQQQLLDQTQALRNEKRGFLDKVKDFGSSLGASFDNFYNKILVGETFLRGAQKKLFTGGYFTSDPSDERNLEYVELKKNLKKYTDQLDKQYANAEWKRNIKGSIYDAVEKGELDRLPEAVAKTIGDVILQLPLTIATGGTSTALQSFPDIYASGLEKMSKETGRTVDDIIESGDDGAVIAAVASTGIGLLDKASAGLISKTIASKGGYAAFRDMLIKGGLGRRAAATISTGANIAKETGIETAQAVTEIGAEELMKIEGDFSRFRDEFVAEISSPQGRKRIAEEAIGGLVGGGGLIAGGRFIKSYQEGTLFETPVINKNTGTGDIDAILIGDVLMERARLQREKIKAVKTDPSKAAEYDAKIQALKLPSAEQASNAYIALQEREAKNGQTEISKELKTIIENYLGNRGLTETNPEPEIPMTLGGIPTQPVPETAPEFEPEMPSTPEQPETIYVPVSDEEMQAYMAEDYLDPERRAGIEDDIARIKSGELDIETIEDQNYRILLDNEMDKAQSVEGDSGMVVDEGNQVESAEQSPEILQDTGVSFDVGEGGAEAGEVAINKPALQKSELQKKQEEVGDTPEYLKNIYANDRRVKKEAEDFASSKSFSELMELDKKSQMSADDAEDAIELEYKKRGASDRQITQLILFGSTPEILNHVSPEAFAFYDPSLKSLHDAAKGISDNNSSVRQAIVLKVKNGIEQNLKANKVPNDIIPRILKHIEDAGLFGNVQGITEMLQNPDWQEDIKNTMAYQLYLKVDDYASQKVDDFERDIPKEIRDAASAIIDKTISDFINQIAKESYNPELGVQKQLPPSEVVEPPQPTPSEPVKEQPSSVQMVKSDTDGDNPKPTFKKGTTQTFELGSAGGRRTSSGLVKLEPISSAYDVFRMNISDDGKYATFEIDNSLKRGTNDLSTELRRLFPFAEFKGIPQGQVGDFETVNKGVARKNENGEWEIIQKAQINVYGRTVKDTENDPPFVKKPISFSSPEKTSQLPPKASSEPVKGASQAKPASSDVESTAKIQNFTQFAKENGYPDDYDTSFQAQLLGGRGLEGKRQSNRSIKEQDDAFQEMQNKKAEGKRAYEQAILEGKVIDPDGKLTREGILKREYDFSKKELESKIANAESGIKNIEGLGKMAHLDNGKLKKGYQKAVDDYNETISKHKETLDKLKSEYEQAKSESLLSKEQTPAQKTQTQPSPQKPIVKESEGGLTKGEEKEDSRKYFEKEYGVPFQKFYDKYVENSSINSYNALAQTSSENGDKIVDEGDFLRAIVSGDQPSKALPKKARISLDYLGDGPVQIKPIPLNIKALPSKTSADITAIIGPTVLKDEMRPAMNGVYFDADSKKQVTTTGHILVSIPDPSINESKLINPKTGAKIDENFPQYKNAIPSYDSLGIKQKINIPDLLSFANAAAKSERFIDVYGGRPALPIAFYFDGEPFFLNPHFLIDALSVFAKQGINEVEFHFDKPNRPIMINGGNTEVLIMPIMGMKEDGSGEFIPHVKYLDRALTKSEFEAQRKAQIRKKLSDLEYHKKEQKKDEADGFKSTYHAEKIKKIEAEINAIDNPIQEQQDLEIVKKAIENGEITEKQAKEFITSDVERGGKIESIVKDAEAENSEQGIAEEITPFTAFSQKGEAGRQARAELKERVGKDKFKLYEEVNKDAEKILRGLEKEGKIKIDCP